MVEVELGGSILFTGNVENNGRMNTTRKATEELQMVLDKVVVGDTLQDTEVMVLLHGLDIMLENTQQIVLLILIGKILLIF